MQLSGFIRSNLDAIMADWEEFARRNAPAVGEMSDLALRDHAREILNAVALDLDAPQSDGEQFIKSQGDSDDDVGPRSAATIHGALRQASDFSLLQLSAEFRALRATVLRLWLPMVKDGPAAMEDMVRFNEAIDQALAQSIIAYSARAELTRDLFLAVLGHDLRSPLANVAMIGELLTRADLPKEKVHSLGLRASRSARFMKHMVDDLLSYTRFQMGRGIPTTLQDCDVADVLRAAVADAEATYPQARFTIAADGNTRGLVDCIRMQQLLTNLLVNAVQHGDGGRPVEVSAAMNDGQIALRVTNHGKTVAPEDCERIFKPLVQLEEGDATDSRSTSLGLGLFIAREIAHAHAGTIGVKSADGIGTTFEVLLPCAAAPVTKAKADHRATATEPSTH